jgi:hypothetical protein
VRKTGIRTASIANYSSVEQGTAPVFSICMVFCNSAKPGVWRLNPDGPEQEYKFTAFEKAKQNKLGST